MEFGLLAAGHLRSAAARYPDDPEIQALIAEALAGRTEFAEIWATHDVEVQRSLTTTMRHPVVGELELDCEVLVAEQSQRCDHRQRAAGVAVLPGAATAQGRRHTGHGRPEDLIVAGSVGVPTLLIVHHTPSPSMQAMFEAVVSGATDPEIEGVTVVRRPALATTASDVLAADGYLLGTPANLGYMSGALKVFFDTVYYPCLDATRGRPFGYYVHGNSDLSGTTRAIESITTGLGWEKASSPVAVTGEPTKIDLEACWELGATVAAGLMT